MAIPLAAVALTVGAWLASAQAPTGVGRILAVVGPVGITEDAFLERALPAREAYRVRSGTDLAPTVMELIDRSVLESLIRAHLMVLEAERRGIEVGDAEAEAFFKTSPYFRTQDSFDPAKYEQLRRADPTQFRVGLENARKRIAGQQLEQRLRTEIEPDDETLRAAVERSLTRARVEYLALAEKDFDGTYPEPSETEIEPYYREHREAYRIPDRAMLSFFAVIGEHVRGVDEMEGRARARPRADSVLSALRAGGDFDQAATVFGNASKGVRISGDNMPAFWESNPRVRDMLFRQSAGAVLPELIPARAGWVIARVDEVSPSRIPDLAEVAREVRERLREIHRKRYQDVQLKHMYESAELPTRPAYHVRYAVFDPESFRAPRPNAAEIDRYYRAHLADYSAYDASSGGLTKRELSEVRGEVEARLVREHQMEEAGKAAARLEQAWQANRRDDRLERSAARLRDVGPVRIGATPDTGLVASALADTLALHAGRRLVGRLDLGGGHVVYDRYRWNADQPVAFEEVRDELAANFEVDRKRDLEIAVRKLYYDHADSLVDGDLAYGGRVFFEPRHVTQVPVTRDEVERYHRDHLSRYSAPALAHVRQILISPSDASPEADRVAREGANDVLRRLRAGEDFTALARELSDDPPTREHGGEVGYFSRGQMLPEFERVAFALKPGQISDPVRTEVGYHIIECLEQLPMVAEPLTRIYTTVGYDVALKKGHQLAYDLADSVLKVTKTAEDAIRVGKEVGGWYELFTFAVGKTDSDEGAATIDSLVKLSRRTPAPRVFISKTRGAYIQWVDSIVPAKQVPWPEVRERAMREYRSATQRRALEAKRSEMDSLLRSRWSFDDLVRGWSGIVETASILPREGLPGRGGADHLDPVVFGSDGPLPLGQLSDWIELPSGWARVRVKEWVRPDTDQVSQAMSNERRDVIEYQLSGIYDQLRARFKVEIRDPVLKKIPFPEFPKPVSMVP